MNFNESQEIATEKPKCGIVMPISAFDNCSAEHWANVLSILKDTINQAGFEPNLVSNSNDSGIIQNRIVQNLYNNEIIVCDVSGRNPNVMFELGLRLAFDKPTIIIKDDKTDYSFDTSIIEHLPYPRELHFNKIVAFKDTLTKKIQATYNKSINDPNYTTFLRHFIDSDIIPTGHFWNAHRKFVSGITGLIRSVEMSNDNIYAISGYLPLLEDIRNDLFFHKRSLGAPPPRPVIRKYLYPLLEELNMDTETALEKSHEIFKHLIKYPEVRSLSVDDSLIERKIRETLYKDTEAV